MIVIYAIDERILDVEKCIKSIKKVYGDNIEIALATYGGKNLRKQPIVSAYAIENNLHYYDMPRQTFITDDDAKEWHACETLARIETTKHFSDIGHKHIFTMHSDVLIKGLFASEFYKLMHGQWSFIGILLRADKDFATLCNKGSWQIRFENNRARLADIVTIYNPEFINALYREYGNTEGIYNNLLKKSTLWGDLAQFDLAREWQGFKGVYINEKDDLDIMCNSTIQHVARETIPGYLPSMVSRGATIDELKRNMERRNV